MPSYPGILANLDTSNGAWTGSGPQWSSGKSAVGMSGPSYMGISPGVGSQAETINNVNKPGR